MESNMNWSATLNWDDAIRRSKLLSKIRYFFEERDIIEVETPLVCQSTVTDVHLDPFITSFNHSKELFNGNSVDMFLQTSPEFCMKRLLASGYQSIYQITKAFRNEAQGRYHNPEFTMLEWYRIGFTQEQLMGEVAELLLEILDCRQPINISYQDVFIRYTSIDPLNTSIGELHQYIASNGKMSEWLMAESNVDTLLQFILSEFIESNIAQAEPWFIFNFPISQASLAQVDDVNPDTAQRFECYYKGIELANGFCELTDHKEQLTRFVKDNEVRDTYGLERRAIDSKFISALESGIPNCSGVAVGIDRLLMLALDKKNIEDVITFCSDRA
jgi:lysyl-tRNA synthetase class 2